MKFFVVLFVTLRGFGDLRSLTRNWTHPLGTLKAQSPHHWTTTEFPMSFFSQTQTNQLCVVKTLMIFFYEPASFPSVYQGLPHLLPREPFAYGFWCFHLASWWHSQMLGMRWRSIWREDPFQAALQCVPCAPSQSCWFTQDHVDVATLWLSLGFLMALMTLVLLQGNWKVGGQLQSINPE